MAKKTVYRKFLFDTYGIIATASFLICVLSGIVLAIPYDLNNPYDSISLILISNPFAGFIRNLHYWSANAFLIFTILHTWDHFALSTEKKLKRPVWYRLVFSVFVLFYVMISGFILKGDPESMQAWRILDSILNGIPWIGDYISLSLLGYSDDFQILYVHHIASSTIILFVVIYEHSRIIWPRAKAMILSLVVLCLISFFFQAPIHDSISPVLKGPWYFLGMQELLHWMSQPLWMFLAVAFLAIGLLIIPVSPESLSKIIKKAFLVLFFLYLLLSLIAFLFRGANWEWKAFWGQNYLSRPSLFIIKPISFEVSDSLRLIEKIPMVKGKRESCLVCHSGMQGFSSSHNPEAIGCSSCHLGNPFSIDKDKAHKSMLLVPGNLQTAGLSCGTSDCHTDITNRIQTNIMASLSGMVSVDKYVFNELDKPGGFFHIKEIKHSPADEHLRDLCASCHLGNSKDSLGPVTQKSRGGGCNACHLNYSKRALAEFVNYYKHDEPIASFPQIHPSLDLNISNEHCFGCHSRSGRIATSYEGWHETQLEWDDVEKDNAMYRVLDDLRVFVSMPEDVHHKAGMSCIDCHNSYELMGDGKAYQHKENQVKIACTDCHFTPGMEQTIVMSDLTAESAAILRIRNEGRTAYKGPFLAIAASGKSLLNTRKTDMNTWYLLSKEGRDSLALKSPEACQRGDAHKRLSCDACHTAWVPRCIGCHNAYDPKQAAYDLLDNKHKTGEWVEYIGEYLTGPPSLGVCISHSDYGPDTIIDCFSPGMILSIDMASFMDSYPEKTIYKRLYAPSHPHTSMSKGRSCSSCHLNPVMLGFGEGKMEYVVINETGTWSFLPKYALRKEDGLPEDAWTAFLNNKAVGKATRSHMRPFSLKEQQDLLTVSSCLKCHDDDSQIMRYSIHNFDSLLMHRTAKCILPEWVFKDL